MAEAVRGEDSEVRDSMKLVADLMGQSARDLAFTRNCIEDGLRQDVIAFARWREVVIRGIDELCQGPYAPNPMMILRILYHDGGMLDITAERYLKDREAS